MLHSPVFPAALPALDLPPDPSLGAQPSLAERWRVAVAPRMVGIVVALLIELALLLLLLSLGVANPKKPEPMVVSVTTHDVEEAPPAPQPSPSARPRAQVQAAAAPAERPQTAPVPVARPPAPPAPLPFVELPSDQLALARISPKKAPAPPAGGAAYGPADSGGGDPDTPRVGTAPNGQPMYAAAWYHEPFDDQLRGYLSTASGPAWGLVACKTVPDWRVEDCVGLDEYPQGSQMLRAILAAAWQFRVRPPRKGGEYMVGSWVRIRIDYEEKRG